MKVARFARVLVRADDRGEFPEAAPRGYGRRCSEEGAEEDDRDRQR
jgi:hypothetical protein